MPQLQENTRQTVLERDGYRCRFCGVTDEQHKDEKGRSLDIHHIIPRRAGGSDDPENLIAVCVECHRTLETTQGDAMERIRNEQIDQSHKQEAEKYKRKFENVLESRDESWNAHSETITAVEGLIESDIKITVHVVHETQVNTSRLLYVGTDGEKATERYKNADGHVTMESASVFVDDWINGFREEEFQSVISETELYPTFRENESVEILKGG